MWPENRGQSGGGGALVAKTCLTLGTPWTVAHQAPLSMGFSRQEYWSGLPFLSPGDLRGLCYLLKREKQVRADSPGLESQIKESKV